MRFADLADQPLEELMDSFVIPERAPKGSPQERQLWLDELAVQIAETGEGGMSFLLWYLPRASAERLQASFVALSLVGRQLNPKRRREISKRIEQFLDGHGPPVVAGVIDALRHLGYRTALARIYSLRNHRSPNVVGAVLRFLSAHDRKRGVPLLEAALKSKSSIIRQNAIDQLDNLNRVRALPRIRRLLDDPDRDVRQAAETAVANLEHIASG